ncbi:MAG TPA: histidine phosphatase family protein [Acidimicrobiales bacterium]|nr:histidine phosphatase family protein [Acidimicrobiales bacterium]
MRILLVLRHAKSDWSHGPDEPDTDRPLSARGRRSADAIGRFIAETGNIPDSAIRSPAKRVVETLTRAMEAGKWRCPVRDSDQLYGLGLEALVGEIRAEVDSTDVLLVVGHEPTCSEAIAHLIGGGHVIMPTAALARVDFDVELWSDVAAETGALRWLLTPRLVGVS